MTTDDNKVPAPLEEAHDTLKYHLLGPSLLKAGQDKVDQKKVSEIIYNASKGSKFFNNEEVKDKRLTAKIEAIKNAKARLEKTPLSVQTRKADEQIALLEATRDLTQKIIHIDCDAFYAAVEELDKPELKLVPFAVGKGVVTTCNYKAREYGVRSGMAGFVAQKLCPQLVQIPLNFEKYTGKAKEVRAILAQYDPRFESAGLDEAYLNITEYCETADMDAFEAVAQIRAEVAEKTLITISAGIAPNARLAKIASNINKPNGQFQIQADRDAVMAFMRDLPTRKVNGIGRVLERELAAIDVKTCGDIYIQRAVLHDLFGFKTSQFLLTCHLGLGFTDVRPSDEHERKSVGTEGTFRDMRGLEDFKQRLRHTAESLEEDLTRVGVKGRTLCLKIKLHTYEVLTRQVILPKAIGTADELYSFALPMLLKINKEIPNMTLRLMGLRMTHLVELNKNVKDIFASGRRADDIPITAAGKKRPYEHDEEWEVWPEEEDDIEKIDNETEEDGEYGSFPEELINEADSVEISPKEKEKEKEQAEKWYCPICQLPQSADDITFNAHVDFCLSKDTIRETVRSSPEKEVQPPPRTRPIGIAQFITRSAPGALQTRQK